MEYLRMVTMYLESCCDDPWSWKPSECSRLCKRSQLYSWKGTVKSVYKIASSLTSVICCIRYTSRTHNGWKICLWNLPLWNGTWPVNSFNNWQIMFSFHALNLEYCYFTISNKIFGSKISTWYNFCWYDHPLVNPRKCFYVCRWIFWWTTLAVATSCLISACPRDRRIIYSYYSILFHLLGISPYVFFKNKFPMSTKKINSLNHLLL